MTTRGCRPLKDAMRVTCAQGMRVGALLALLMALVACREAPPARRTGPWVAAELPVMDAQALVARAQAEGARGALVALWATWCEPCLAEMPILDAVAQAHPDLAVLGLATDDPGSPIAKGRIDAVFQRLAPRYEQARIEPGGEHKLLADLGLAWDGILPKTLLIAPDGKAILVDGHERASLEAAIARLGTR